MWFSLPVLIFNLEQVGRMTLGGLLALGYNVVVSYKRASTAVVLAVFPCHLKQLILSEKPSWC